MKRALAPQRHRKDLDDGDPPAFVNEREKTVPHCCRCGREVPQARSLWTLCEECIRQSLEIPAAPMARHPQGTQGTISELARKLALTLARSAGNHTQIPPSAVLWHEERFRRRGVDPVAALRLAEGLAADPVHRAGCEQCRGDLVEIETQLLRPKDETARLVEVGKSHLPKRLPCR